MNNYSFYKYKFNNLQFNKKTDINLYIKNIVKNIDLYHKIKPDHEHFNVFMEIINHHKDKEYKLGCGIKYFIFKEGEIFREKQLILKRIDGTKETMSYNYNKITCNDTDKSKRRQAMRLSISDQILNYKKTLNHSTCNICKETVKKIQIDHVYPFCAIADEYLKDKTFDVIKIKQYYQFLNDDDKKEWENYHLKHASYQPLCAKCNINKSNKII